ncbi:MAG: hypothetical protein JWO58_822 [Chitinophagaceae bacterium]|nr:hypothetical protein [Chitinophagaceae bacterium]
MLSYRYMSMSMRNMLVGSSSISDGELFNKNYSMSSNRMHMDMHMLMAMYGVTDKLTLMAMVNYTVISMNMTSLTPVMSMPGMDMSSDVNMNMKTSGLSDVKINALYSLVNSHSHHVLVSGGFSIPTGSIRVSGDANSMYPDHRLPYDMQLGSGTWDILPVLNYIRQNDRISWSTQISSVIRTGYNSVGYKLGNEVTWNNWLAFQWSRLFSSSLRLEGNASSAIKGYDPSFTYLTYEPATNPANYGGQHVNGYIGTNIYLRSLLNSKLGVEYGIPFYQHLNGPQMSFKSSLYASWSVMF